MKSKEERNNRSNKKFYYSLATILVVLGILGFVENRIDSKVERHPTVVEMKTEQKNMSEKLEEVRSELSKMNTELNKINTKLNRLLMEEYHP